MGTGKDNFHEIRSLSKCSPEPLPSESSILELSPTFSLTEPISAPIAETIELKPRSLLSPTRENIADLYLQGQGIEIGALHHPLTVPEDVKVLYVDRMSVADLRKQYPELNDLPLVEANILENGEDLETIADNTQDFVIANHFIEHCQDTIGAIQNKICFGCSSPEVFYIVPSQTSEGASMSIVRSRPLNIYGEIILKAPLDQNENILKVGFAMLAITKMMLKL